MATRHGWSLSPRLRCDALEPRLAPAAPLVIDFATGFTAAGLPGGLPAGYADGDLLLTDGPFMDAKEHVGGFLLVEADDLDGALDLAARIPAARMGGAVEVRPLVER